MAVLLVVLFIQHFYEEVDEEFVYYLMAEGSHVKADFLGKKITRKIDGNFLM